MSTESMMEFMTKHIEHVVYVMFENRGFDHMLGFLYESNQSAINWIPKSTEKQFRGLPNPLPKLPADASYYDDPANYKGPWKSIQKANGKYCCTPSVDPGEAFEYVTNQIYGKADNTGLSQEYQMKGFWLDWQKHRGRAGEDEILQCNSEKELPVLDALAKAFAVSDDYFCSVPTQTNPNRGFSLAGTSLGRIINQSACGKTFDSKTTIFNAFDKRHYGNPTATWKIYYPHYWYCSGHEQAYTRYMYKPLQQFKEDGAKFGGIGDDPNPNSGTFLADAAAGKLPALSYLEPVFIGERLLTDVSSYHPPTSLKQGEIFLHKIYKALRNSPKWDKTLLIVNFDEHGGTYDHVPPPTNASKPDDSPSSFDFKRFGVRVPFLLISPWIKNNTVIRPDPAGCAQVLPFDHTSILATLCKWKQIPYMSPGNTIEYELGERTRSAPTFEHVFSNEYDMNKLKAESIKPAECSDERCRYMASSTGRKFVEQAVTRATGFEAGSEDHNKAMENIQNNFSRPEDITRYIEQL